MTAEIRRTLLHVETTLRDGGREATTPMKLIAAVAVLTNPWAGRGFVENMRPEVQAVSPEVGRLLVEMITVAAGVPPQARQPAPRAACSRQIRARPRGS